MGWIDGQKKALDDQHFLQLFTPRRARSIWSRINVDKATAPIAVVPVQAPGHAQTEAAKAKILFATLNAANRYVVLWRIQAAAKPETRAKRTARLVGVLARGEALHIFVPREQP